MNHNKQELLEKKFRKAKKELDSLTEQMYRLPYRELKEPYQDGWWVMLTLRADILRSSKGPVLKKLIEEYSIKQRTRSVKVIQQIRRTPTLANARRVLHNKHLYDIAWIRDISKRKYGSIPKEQSKYFSSYILPKYHSIGVEIYRLNLPEYYFIIKIKKRIITHVQDINPELLRRQAELKLILNPYWRRLRHRDKYYCQYYDNRSERRDSKVKLHNLLIESRQLSQLYNL